MKNREKQNRITVHILNRLRSPDIAAVLDLAASVLPSVLTKEEMWLQCDAADAKVGLDKTLSEKC